MLELTMWFWSVSLADQLSGQFLIFLVGQKKFGCLREGQFFSSSFFMKIDNSLISRLEKKMPVSEMGQFFLDDQKKEIDRTIGRLRD